LGREADAILVAPATADFLARTSEGRAEDLLGATILASEAPLFIAPAMHPAMFRAAATQQNVSRLRTRGVNILGPARGEVASGDVGLGRMEEPETIVKSLALEMMGPRLLSGRHIIVSAGPTAEPLDPVRMLTNVSSGKMGFAIAEHAALLGANVTLVAGPVGLETPPHVKRVDVQTALEMRAALRQAAGDGLDACDAIIMAAAVSDFRPAHRSVEKLHREGGPVRMDFLPNPDLLQELGMERRGTRPVLVGFALETSSGDALIQRARRKMIEKRVDLVVANVADQSLGRDTNEVLLVSAQDCRATGKKPKLAIAADILDWVHRRLEQAGGEWSA
jgi:phosphopantothenoylcysteine decarboxylase/phosphopantothenate--cysteine ligase